MKRGGFVAWFACLSIGAVGCAVGVSEDEVYRGLDDVARAPRSGVSGTVWAPNNGPGDVPEGREVPIAGALVRLLELRPGPLEDGVHCRRCLEGGGWWSTFSDARGRFFLEDVDPGAYWLVIEAGPFRRDVRVRVDEDERTVRVDDEDTELPSVHDPGEGRFAPRVALLAGSADRAGRWLGQLGLGGLDAEGWYAPRVDDRVDVFDHGAYAGSSAAHALLRDRARLFRYHVMLVPSSDGGSLEEALALWRDEDAIRNLRDWLASGGVLISTGASARFCDAPWPAALSVDPDHDVPASAYDEAADTWRLEEVPVLPEAREPYDSPHARAVDGALASWLDAQRGPGYALYHWGPDGVFTGPDPRLVGDYDPLDLPVLGSTAVIEALRPLGPEQMPPRVLLEGANGSGDLMRGPLAVAFDTPGCGRWMYSTAPLSATAGHELSVMERVALHFLVSTPVCTRAPI